LIPLAMADPPPCSSNGDAAASLMNMFKDMKPPTVPAAASAPSAPASAASSPTAAQNPKIPARDSSARDDDIFKSSPNAGDGERVSTLTQSLRLAAEEQSAAAEGSDGGAPGVGRQQSGSGGAQSQPWRLKFLHKVGVTDPGAKEIGASGAHEAPDLFRRSSNSPSQNDTRPAGHDEVVRVRQAAAPRSSDDIRLGYIKKLENSRRFIPQLSRPKAAQTVTIFDWDDTLLCTTHLEMQQRQHGAIPAQVREQLLGLERVVTSLLQQADQVGKVFIITNASEGWVQHSSQMCLPNLAPLLENVTIISARAGFEASFPGDSHAWKMHAFLQVQNKLHSEAVTNLLSVGDSHIEMDAVHLLGRSFAHALVKTVKLWERPTPYELQKQLEVVAEKLPEIYRSGTTLNIWLERENAQQQQQQQQ